MANGNQNIHTVGTSARHRAKHSAEPNDALDDVLKAPPVIGPKQPVTIAQGVRLAKGQAYRAKLDKAEADLERWLGKLLRAANRVDAARKQVARYRKIVSEL